MKIPFSLQSRFVATVATALRAQEASAFPAKPIRVDFGTTGGYRGRLKVTIGLDARHFDTDWQGKDPTRFPARIKAAATALRDVGMTGAFIITHENGNLTIATV